MRYTFLTVFSFLLLAFASCDKKEKAITLPAAGSAQFGRVDMGKEYDTMIYYDFEHNVVVKSSRLASWDLAFESAPDGKHVFLNGGLNMEVLNTHKQSFKDIKALPAATTPLSDWHIDSPDGANAGTGIGEWSDGGGLTKGEVYIVLTGAVGVPTSKARKLKLLAVSAQQYTLQWGEMGDTAGVTITVPKAAACNYSYFSFSSGITSPEPPKDSWDVVFTHYKELVYDASKSQDIGYVVTGLLLNPANTSAAKDSTHSYATIDLAAAQALPASHKRNAIGYDWKDYNINTGQYTVHPNKVYILHSRGGHLIKLHFLDFLSPNGVKGSPSFESEVML